MCSVGIQTRRVSPTCMSRSADLSAGGILSRGSGTVSPVGMEESITFPLMSQPE